MPQDFTYLAGYSLTTTLPPLAALFFLSRGS
jgi:hypothetical protein